MHLSIINHPAMGGTTMAMETSILNYCHGPIITMKSAGLVRPFSLDQVRGRYDAGAGGCFRIGSENIFLFLLFDNVLFFRLLLGFMLNFRVVMREGERLTKIHGFLI